MAARRCSLCGISFPAYGLGSNCPLHTDEELTLFSNIEPDADWREQLDRRKRYAEEDAADAALIPAVKATVSVRENQLWLSSWDIINSGVRNRLQAGDLVRVGNQVLEILGYRESRRAYWVRAFETTVSDDGIARLLRGQ